VKKAGIDFGCATIFSTTYKERMQVTALRLTHAAKVAELYCEQVIVADLDFVKCCPFISLMLYSEMFWNIFAIRGKCLKKQQLLKSEGYGC